MANAARSQSLRRPRPSSSRWNTAAVIFDFDGLILDTEQPCIDSWASVYRRFGQELPIDDFKKLVGATYNVFDPRTDLEKRVGRRLDWEMLDQERLAEHRNSLLNHNTLPGVCDWIQTARRNGLKLGVASSSSHAWVDDHLDRLKLADLFDVVRCRDDVQRAKPHPDLYLSAMKVLGLAPETGLAVEDSHHGSIAAIRAGLRCIAAPGPLTRDQDFCHVDLVIDSLADHSLEEILNRLPGNKARGART